MSEKRPAAGFLSRLKSPIAPLAEAARRLGQRRRADGEEESTELVPAAGADDQSLVATTDGRPQTPPVQSLTPEDFRLALEQFVREDHGRFSTRLHIISLVELREASAERWFRFADKVMMIAEGVIGKYLGPGNLFCRQGSDYFTLVFRHCDAAEANRRANAIAQELGVRLVGDQFEGGERPLALATELSLDDALLADGRLNTTAINLAVKEQRAKVVPVKVSDKRPDPSWQANGGPTDGAGKAGPDWGDSSPPPPQRQNDGDPQSITTGNRRPKALQDPGWVPMQVSKRDAAALTNWVSIDRGADQMPALTAPALAWRPTWTHEGECIGTYLARPSRRDTPDGPPLDGPRAYPPGQDGLARALDRFCIAAAVRDILAAEKAGLGCTMVIPLHWATLVGDTNGDTLHPFADLPQTVRATRVVIELFAVPEAADHALLAHAVDVARPLGREVLLRTRLDVADLAIATQSGFTMVGVDLDQCEGVATDSDQRLTDRLRTFHAAAHHHGLGAYLWSARRRSAAVAAILGGFALVNGPAMMKDIAKPARVLPAPRSRFAPPPPR